jgi:hypothetical protein
MIDVTGYDFLDFGTGYGGCYDFAREKLGGRIGLGFEFLRHRVVALKKEGYNCHLADITKISFPKKSVRFITISHVLEHLPNLKEVEKVINTAINTATEFVFIEGPSFDFDDVLKQHGLKFYWVGWTNHPSNVTTGLIKQTAKHNKIHRYDLLTENPSISDSASVDIVPLKAKAGSKYDPVAYGPKPMVVFDKPIFRSFVCFLWLKPVEERLKLLTTRKKFTLYESGVF